MRMLLPLLLACSETETGVSSGTDTASSDTQVTIDDVSYLPSPVLPATPFSYETTLPTHLQVRSVTMSDNTPGFNPITDAGATLGRVLFYDKRLSRNGEVSCSSCHQQDRGFSDPDEFSVGFEGELTGRNSMGLINVRYYPGGAMFWDERAASLEEQVLMPIQDSVEMGMSLPDLVQRLGNTDFYGPLFTDAFGDEQVTEQRISFALAQFVRSIVSFDAPFDQEIASVGDPRPDFPGFTAQENRGKSIFFGEHDENSRGLCGSCHMMNNPAMFTPDGGGPPGAPELDNLGLLIMMNPANNGFIDDDDYGLGDATGDARRDTHFKMSTLRNVALTGPYMHDGSFETLEDVVEHYNSGVEFHQNLAPQLIAAGPGQPPGNQPLRLNLTESDKAAMVAFLHTLTDPTIATTERWSDPFPE